MTLIKLRKLMTNPAIKYFTEFILSTLKEKGTSKKEEEGENILKLSSA